MRNETYLSKFIGCVGCWWQWQRSFHELCLFFSSCRRTAFISIHSMAYNVYIIIYFWLFGGAIFVLCAKFRCECESIQVTTQYLIHRIHTIMELLWPPMFRYNIHYTLYRVEGTIGVIHRIFFHYFYDVVLWSCGRSRCTYSREFITLSLYNENSLRHCHFSIKNVMISFLHLFQLFHLFYRQFYLQFSFCHVDYSCCSFCW